jgi:hypothetical protein
MTARACLGCRHSCMGGMPSEWALQHKTSHCPHKSTRRAQSAMHGSRDDSCGACTLCLHLQPNMKTTGQAGRPHAVSSPQRHQNLHPSPEKPTSEPAAARRAFTPFSLWPCGPAALCPMPGVMGEEGARRRLWDPACAVEAPMLACAATGTGEALLAGADELPLAASAAAGAGCCADGCCWGVLAPAGADCCGCGWSGTGFGRSETCVFCGICRGSASRCHGGWRVQLRLVMMVQASCCTLHACRSRPVGTCSLGAREHQ